MPLGPKRPWAVLAFCWLGWVFDFYDLVLFAFTKVAIGRDLGFAEPVTTLAWIEGWSLAATAIGGLAFGRFADHAGRRPAMVLSILVFSLGALLTGLAQGFWSLWFARVVTGLGVGGEWGIGHALVAETFRGRSRDRAHGLLQAGSPFAMALAAAVGCFLAPRPEIGWRAVFVASSGLGILALFARWFLPAVALPTGERLPLRLLWAPSYRSATVSLLTVLTLHMAGFWCVYAELPGALMRLHQVAPADVGWFQIRVNAVHVVADIGFGFAAAAFGRIRTFVVCCLLFAAGHLVVLQQLQNVSAAFGTFTIAVALMGLGAGTWSCFGALFGAHYPPALRATAAASLYALARLVQLPLKPLLAAPQAAGTFAPALWIGAGCAVASAIVAICLRAPRTAANAT
jgi:MFS family permease